MELAFSMFAISIEQNRGGIEEWELKRRSVKKTAVPCAAISIGHTFETKK